MNNHRELEVRCRKEFNEAELLSKAEFEKLEEKNNRIQKMNRGLQKSIKKRFNLK